MDTEFNLDPDPWEQQAREDEERLYLIEHLKDLWEIAKMLDPKKQEAVKVIASRCGLEKEFNQLIRKEMK